MRLVVLSVLATGRPPHLQDIIPPRPPSTLSHTHTTPQSMPPATPHTAPPTVHNSSHPPVHIPQSNTMPQFTKIATWNIDRQATYAGPITACLHGDLDLLHCTEPATHMTPGTRTTATLTNDADKAGYALYVTKHSHTLSLIHI